MPIFRTDGRLIYFAHVPKCAGTAIEFYLADRFGPLALVDRRFLSVPEPQRWSKSSPQHIPLACLSRLFPEDFFDASFAVIRHPVDRLASVFLFQAEQEGTIPDEMSFADWLARLPVLWEEDPFVYDNHTRPMCDFVPEGARLFRLEAGLDQVTDWLDQLTGSRDERRIGEVNRRAQRLRRRKARALTVTERDRALIAELYAADFDRFGYDPAAVTEH